MRTARLVRVGNDHDPPAPGGPQLLGVLGPPLPRAARVAGRRQVQGSQPVDVLLALGHDGSLTAGQRVQAVESGRDAVEVPAVAAVSARPPLPIAGRFEPGRMDRIDESLYPMLATREALANALCHRDYAVGGRSIGVALYDDRLRAILTLLDREGHPLALREIRAGLAEQVDGRRLREDLAELKTKGLITPAGHGRDARWTRL